MAKDVRRALMIASEPLKVPSTYASMDPDARAAWKTDQMAREGHGSFSPPGTPEREENFNRWHGNSKIRDGEGNPLRLYHATPKSFDTFLPGGPNPANEMPSGPATWLSPYPDKQPAGHHVGGFEGKYKSGANVMPVHADIRNPLVIDNKTMRDWARQSYAKGSGEFPLLISPESRKMLLEDGYDGILWAGFDATAKDEAFYDDHGIGEHPSKDEEIIALHPPGRAQIKSAIGNRGQYDPEDTHVNYARGGDVGAKRALMIAKASRATDPQQTARAKDLGFDTDKVWYHSSLSPLDKFDAHGKFMGRSGTAGIHLTDSPEAASRYLDRYGDYDYKGRPFQKNIIPVYVKAGKVLERNEPFKSPIGLGMPVPEGYENPVKKMGYDALLRREGINKRGSVVGHVEPGGRDSVDHAELVLHDPSRVRSVFAQYDPDATEGPELSRAAGGSATKRALMIARDQRALLRRIANIYPGPGGGMDPSPGGGGYSGPGGGKYIGPSRLAKGGAVDAKARFLEGTKVSHPDGRPKVVYHGTNQNFSRFSPAKLGKHTGTVSAKGFFFSEHPGEANEYAAMSARRQVSNADEMAKTSKQLMRQIAQAEARGDWGLQEKLTLQLEENENEAMTGEERGANVMPVHLAIRNPMVVDMNHGADLHAVEQAIAQAKTKGHDGLRLDNVFDPVGDRPENFSTTQWVAFKPEQIKSATGNRGTYSPTSPDITKSHGGYIGRAEGGKVPPFKLHSGAAKIIGAKGQKKATPQQYAAMPGIKPDELKHSKFDTLGSKALPREEVIKHLEDNAVPLQESELRDEQPPNWDGETSYTASKFSEHTLPGGENYREVLLHTPAEHTPSPELEKARERAEAATRTFDDALYNQLSNADNADDEAYQRASAEVDEARIALARLERADRSAASNAGFRGGHWDQPNVLAHVRMSDRVGPNGEKILHLEESQSDWGQQGRDQGFRDNYVNRLTPDEDAELTKLFNMSPRERDTARYEELRAKARDASVKVMGIVPGPYVDNTQKWTDLALKRVLHEAAHGGYDKIVVTPGDEQNKRYDLSSQVKNISYFPDIGYLNAETHDGKGLDEHDVKPGDLAKHIGKEAADRILKQELQRHEGRGRLGGEFYHELEGDGLKMGGAGMRGYYDNILPKRLQALAQQHDPQAKVNLFGHGLPSERAHAGVSGADVMTERGIPEHEQDAYWRGLTPQERTDHIEDHRMNGAPTQLHSLDVTPQMRDSIKGNGFNSFKRGGEVEDPIKNWQWRPVDDVRNELQLDEIPSHVHKFGEFMDETARRAATQGLTPRDLIKAYAITRASIGRRALPVETLRSTFPELPKGVAGRVRPEGAMGHWLHTKMGQRYLDAAEAGRVDEEAIAHAQNSMRRFGKVETEPSALRWAAKNLPGREGRVSELIARAHHGQSSPEEWRGEMRVPGVAASKAGFLASMLGRGDQPTLDARQIILHTGRPTKEAAPILGRTGAADAAVNRLADRQTELGFKHDKSMSPFYQHLAHHAIWDKTAGEETTHDDLMQALRGAKDGGRQGYASGGGDKPLSLIASHPVVQGLSMALPSEADLQQLLRKAGIVRPYNQPSQDDVEKALKIAQRYAMPLGVGSKNDPSAYYNVKQPVAARDVTTKATATKGYALKPENPLSWQQFGGIGKGGHVINLSGDRTRFGTLHEINGKPLNWPVRVYAGPDYIREPNKGMVWASAAPVIGNMNKLVRELSKKGPVFGMYSPYGGAGGDFAHHMFDAVMAQVNPDQIDDAAKNKFDAAMRGAHFIMGQTDKIKAKRSRVAERMAGWPGISDPKAASEFARKKMTGDQRKAILEYLDKTSWIDEGFPHVGMTRVAVTDPKLLGVPENMIGGNVARLEPSDKQMKSGHTTFEAGQPGEYVGTLPFAQRHYALPVSSGHFLRTPSAGKGVHVDPYSLNDKAREGYRTLYERNYVPEPVSQQMVEGAEEGIMKKPLYGLKTGGRAGYAPGGGIAQLQQNLQGAFSDLNRQVAAQAPQQQQAMSQQAPYGAYQRMDAQARGDAPNDASRALMYNALNGKTYEGLFPKAATPAAPTAPAPAAPAAPEPVPVDTASPQTPNYSDMLQGGDGGAGFKRGGKVHKKSNIIERALAVTRRK